MTAFTTRIFSSTDSTTYLSRGSMSAICESLKNSTHPLVKTGLVEVKADGMFDDAILQLTEAGEALLFEDDMELFEQPITGSDIIQPDSVVKKRLFFRR